MKTYKLLNAIRYVDARTARRFIDASVGDLEQTVVNSLGKFSRTSIPGNASQTFGTEISSICKSIIAGNGVGIADKIDSFAKSLKNFRQKNISAKNVIDGAKINTALQELKKQAAVLARGGAPAKSENRSAGWGKSKVRSPSNVSMVGRPAVVAPSKTWASLKSSVERWAQQSAKGLTLAKNGKVYYNGKPVNENNIPSSIAGLVEYYPNKEEAIKGINNILRENLEKRRMSIVNAVKGNQSKNAAAANAYRLRNKNKLDPGLEEEFRNEGLSHSKSNYQRATAGKPDGARQRKIELAMDISRVIGNRGAGLDNVDERIDMAVARDALANIKSGISSLKLGRDREASDAFYQAKKILNKTGNNKDLFPNLHSKLTSLITMVKKRDSAYRIRKRSRMTNPICYGYRF